jgi:GNAT superfamily N-acetyltransferase
MNEMPSGITIRAVRPDDKEGIVRAFHALDRRSVYLRFFSYRKELTEAELRRVTECDGVNQAVLVATHGSGDRKIIVGMGSYARSGAAAEIALAVAEDFRRHGIATQLLRELVGIARSSGIERFEANVLVENSPMLALLRNSTLPMRTSHEPGVVHATLLLPKEATHE